MIDLSAAYAGGSDDAYAERLCREAVSYCRTHLPENHPEVETALFNLGSVLLRRGSRSDGLAILERTFETRQKYAPDDPDLSYLCMTLARAYVSTGRRKSACTLYKQISALIRRREVQIQPRVVGGMLDAAAFFQTYGAYADAEELYLFAIDYFAPHEGSEADSAYVRSHADLAALYHMLGRGPECRAMAEKALDLMATSGQRGSLEWSTILNTLGESHRADANYDRAIQLLEASLAIRMDRAGPESHLVATVLNNLGLARFAKGEVGEAETMFGRAAAIDRSALGADSVDYAVDLHNLGQLFASTGREVGALPLHEEALAIRRAAFGGQDPVLAEWSHDLALLYLNDGRLSEARS
jgi:tetratricopeptide (TPR) repeat protein